MSSAHLELLTESDQQGMLAHVRFSVRSGALADPTDKPGLSYFTARALLRGTKRLAYRDFVDAIETLGGSLTASADYSQVVFSGSVIAPNLLPFLELMVEAFTEPRFEESELAKLRPMIEGEIINDLQDVATVCGRALLISLFQGTRLAHPSAGDPEKVAGFTRQDVLTTAKRQYVTGNILVGLTLPASLGEHNQVVTEVEKILARLPSGPRISVAYPRPNWDGKRAVLVERSDMSTIPTFIATPGLPDSDSNLPELELANFIFGGDFTARLMQILRAKNGWTYGASSGYSQLLGPNRELGLFSIYTFPSTEFARPALEASLKLLSEYVSSGLTEEEFETARQAMRGKYVFKVDTASKRLALRMREKLTGRPHLKPEAYLDRLHRLKRADLNRLIQESLPLDDLRIAWVGDHATLAPILRAQPGISEVEVLDLGT